jgi:hypothetical protein
MLLCYLKFNFFKFSQKSEVLHIRMDFFKDMATFLNKIIITFGGQFFKSFGMGICTPGFPEM